MGWLYDSFVSFFGRDTRDENSATATTPSSSATPPLASHSPSHKVTRSRPGSSSSKPQPSPRVSSPPLFNARLSPSLRPVSSQRFKSYISPPLSPASSQRLSLNPHFYSPLSPPLSPASSQRFSPNRHFSPNISPTFSRASSQRLSPPHFNSRVSPPLSPPSPLVYDLFLSFRFEDTGNNFTSHLYKALSEARIRTAGGPRVPLSSTENISTEFRHAIRASEMYIIIFSENYAHSIWLLQELRHIIEHSELTGRPIIPLFYNVEPHYLQLEAERLGDAIFESYEYSDNSTTHFMEKCRVALSTAAELPGVVIDDTT